MKNIKRLFVLFFVLTLIFSYTPNSYASSGRLSGKIIVVDAGHGGSDPGAIGKLSTFNGTITVYESDLTLTYASALKDELENEGATVIMTRDDDYYVGINDRWKIATRANADAFISIHFDWIKAPDGNMSFYGQDRPQDKTFATILHNSVVQDPSYLLGDRGVKSCKSSGVKYLGVLNYGGDYPRVLMEVNNIDLEGTQGCEFLTQAYNWSYSIINGLDTYFN